MNYTHRSIEPLLEKAAASFPVIVVTGPRQTGKSTLCRHLFSEYSYVTLDDPIQGSLAVRDPGLFVDSLGPNVIVDEIQYAPQLLPYIKMAVDQERHQSGRYILTGSQAFQMMQGVSESLAGRAAIFELLGMDFREVPVDAIKGRDQIFFRIRQGSYPDTLLHGVDTDIFYSSYIATYLERDLRNLLQVQDLRLFQGFLELLAARCGMLLNKAELSRVLGITGGTIDRWLSVLETSRIIYLLRPYHRNMTKRVVKSPKLYFTDTGMAAYLLRYTDYRVMAAGPQNGSLFENFLVMEVLRRSLSLSVPPNLYFYRDSNGSEIDLIIDSQNGLKLIEIKLAQTIRDPFIESLSRQLRNFEQSRGYLVSLYETRTPLTRDIVAMPWRNIHELVD